MGGPAFCHYGDIQIEWQMSVDCNGRASSSLASIRFDTLHCIRLPFIVAVFAVGMLRTGELVVGYVLRS